MYSRRFSEGDGVAPSTVLADASQPWYKLFVITAQRIQCSIIDESRRGILLVAVTSVRVTNDITGSAEQERVHADVGDLCVYVAQTDVDMQATTPWLSAFDDSDSLRGGMLPPQP